MKIKTVVLVITGILAVVSVAGLAFAQANPGQSKLNGKMMDTDSYGSTPYQDDLYKDMIKIMKKNGYEEMAEAMKKNDYEAMDEFMNNMTDEDFSKMIEIMRANGYEGMAGMMESMGREEMLRMHNSMGGSANCHAATNNMMQAN